MIVYLNKIAFTNDFFNTMLPDGSYLVLNKIDESMLADGVTEAVDIKAINVMLVDEEGNITKCPCVIGLENDYLQILTDYAEYEGQVLTSAHMEYCTIEVYE